MYIELQVNKKNIHTTVTKLSLYKQSKIIETVDQNNNYFYLVFYKDQYINGVKADHIKLDSHIHQAFTKGISVANDHPVIEPLISNQPFTLTRFNQLYKKLQQHYSPIETALIFTFFDSFTTKGSTIKLLKKTYYDFRRNGKMLKSYKTLHMLADHDANDKFAKDILGSMEFQRFEERYQNVDELIQIDTDHLESLYYQQTNSHDYFNSLIQLYKLEKRWIDLFIVQTNMLKATFEKTLWEAFQQSLKTFTVGEQINILSDLYEANPQQEVEELLTTKLIDSANHSKLVKFLLEHNYKPTEKQLEKIIDHLAEIDPKVLTDYFNESNQRLLQLCSNVSTKQAEKIITPFIKGFLQNHSITEIKRWFEPFQVANYHFPIEQTLDKMNQLQDDPDNQYSLGELYASFALYEQAIDCYKWEIELDPSSGKAMQALVKLYKKTGNDTEAENYQNLLIQTQKYG
ncbi:hypothetical protein GCM10011351_15220 [Paraliobacillus quinghaiensis]|uniref:Tetratricopeptide repeat protein n=1 Tax=Paraliobacillus quinghaiensis TaxID=470815 RepID=A0A917TPC7_9BACI|nr:hypothetical protein [Paraliobacillus quinghaiensis]GGM30030.1 hypothetical protein GCM10011351_15220 [Paraliobacillus quinghaiensis]